MSFALPGLRATLSLSLLDGSLLKGVNNEYQRGREDCREGILPDPPKDDPKHDDPWPREGDDPERMNDYLLEK
jgi:hypothetical protein